MLTAPVIRPTTRHAARVPTLAGLGAVLSVGSLAGAPPVLATVAVAAAWWFTLARRWGAALASGGVLLLWVSAAFMVVSFGRIVPGPLGLSVIGAHLLAAIGAAWADARTPAIAPAHVGRLTLFAATAGPVAWVLGTTLATFLPRGSGLSWAAHIDSSLDVWEMRANTLRGGTALASSGNPRPLEHTLGTTLLPPFHTVDGSGHALAEELSAHGASWSILVCATAFLAGLTAAAFVGRDSRSNRVPAVAAAVTSLAMVSVAVTGAALLLGQINAHLVIAVILASLLVTLHRAESPAAACGLLLLATTALLVSWTPFAAVPGTMLLLTAVRSRGSLRDAPLRAVAWLGVSGVVTAWAVSNFAGEELVRAMARTEQQNEGVVAVVAYSGALNPVFLPFSVAVMVSLIGLGVWFLGSRAGSETRWEGQTALAAAAGTFIGLAPIVATGIDLTGELGYYPAKYLSLATVALAVPAAGLASRAALVRTSLAPRIAGWLAITAMVTTAVVSPAARDSGWVPVTVPLATGAGFGTAHQLADRAVDFTREDTLVIPWMLDDDFDFDVQWLMSVALPPGAGFWNDAVRAALRLHKDDFSAEAACRIAEVEARSVVLVTSAPDLRSGIASTCPLENVTVDYAGE